MRGHKQGDGRHHRGFFNPVEGDAFEVPKECCAGPQRDHEHGQVCEIGDEIVIEQRVIGPVQEVNHDCAAAFTRMFSWGGCDSTDSFPVCKTSSKISLVSLLFPVSSLISATRPACRPAFSKAVKKACKPYWSWRATTFSKIGINSVLKSMRPSAARSRTS